jgi:hypothetical protein
VHDTPVSTKGAGYNSAKSAAIWMWEVHNSVTLRVKNEEGTKGSVWPSVGACPKCYVNGDVSHFDKDVVYDFLADYYYRTSKILSLKEELLASDKLYLAGDAEEVQLTSWWRASFTILAVLLIILCLKEFMLGGKLCGRRKKRRN